MSDIFDHIPGIVAGERIDAPQDFADSVLERIAVEKAGGLKAMNPLSRIMFLALIFVVYSSLGVFLGAKSYRTVNPDDQVHDHAVIELKNNLHLNPVEELDLNFRPLIINSQNNN